MAKTAQNNDYAFDAENVKEATELHRLFLETQTIMACGNSELTIRVCDDMANDVVVACLILREMKNLPIFYDDKEWLNLYYWDVNQFVFYHAVNLYKAYLKSLPLSELLKVL
jgi:hypothetical protein